DGEVEVDHHLRLVGAGGVERLDGDQPGPPAGQRGLVRVAQLYLFGQDLIGVERQEGRGGALHVVVVVAESLGDVGVAILVAGGGPDCAVATAAVVAGEVLAPEALVVGIERAAGGDQ